MVNEKFQIRDISDKNKKIKWEKINKEISLTDLKKSILSSIENYDVKGLNWSDIYKEFEEIAEILVILKLIDQLVEEDKIELFSESNKKYVLTEKYMNTLEL